MIQEMCKQNQENSISRTEGDMFKSKEMVNIEIWSRNVKCRENRKTHKSSKYEQVLFLENICKRNLFVSPANLA